MADGDPIQQRLALRIVAQQHGSAILDGDFAVSGRNRREWQTQITPAIPPDDSPIAGDRKGPIAGVAGLHDQRQLHAVVLVGCPIGCGSARASRNLDLSVRTPLDAPSAHPE